MSIHAKPRYGPHASTRILIGFVLVCAAAFVGYRLYTTLAVDKRVYPPLPPSSVNLVGVDTSAGFRIIVANGIAQVIEQDIVEGGPDTDQAEDDSSSDAPKRRIPIKEMLGAINGDPASVSRFVMVLNEMSEDDLPPDRVYWDAGDIEKALSGDETLRKRLEADLNTKLDGTPIASLNPRNLDRGIVIRASVELEVSASDGMRHVGGDILIPYQTRFMRAVHDRVKRKADLTNEVLVGYYSLEAKATLEKASLREQVAESLKRLISKESLAEKAELPQRVLNGTKVVLTDAFIENASLSTVETGRGELYQIEMDVNEEGRQRLWQFSNQNVGKQLLLIVDGVAVAAPRIDHELSQSSITISKIRDRRLAEEALAGIQASKEKKQSND